MKWHPDHEPSLWLRSKIAHARRTARPRCPHLLSRTASAKPVVALWTPGAVCSQCFPPVSVHGGMAEHDHECDRCGAVDHGDFHPLFLDAGGLLVALGLCRICFKKEVPTEERERLVSDD